MKRLHRSCYLNKKIIEMFKSFFLLLSQIKVTVCRSRFVIELKKMERLNHSRYLPF
jgi:hypothetical protein